MNEMTDMPENEDEISLIDLLAVMIRHRKLIVFGTAAAAVTAGLWLYALPKIRAAKQPLEGQKAAAEAMATDDVQNRELNVIYTIKASRCPSYGTEQPWNDFDFSKVLYDAFNGLPEVARVYREHPFMGQNYPTEKILYNDFISSLVVDNKFFSLDINKNWGREYRNAYHLSVKVMEKDLDVMTAFVNELLAETSESLSSSMGIEPAYRFYTLSEEPFVTTTTTTTTTITVNKKFIIVVFAAFFVFVFLAFALNALENIKKDGQAMAVLKNAWGKDE